MSYRCLAAVFTVIAVVALTPMFTAAQSAEPPRTPWGAPDLQGVWDFRSITPMERPEALADKEFLTEEEAANLEQEAVDRNERLANQPAQRTQVTDSVDRREDGGPGFYNNFWLDRGTNTVGTRRTSLIVDPADGRIPPLTPAGTQRREARSARPDVPTGPEDLPFIERCYLGFNSGPPMVPSAYNNNMQLFQTSDYVVILTEMVHEARIVPLDGPSASPSGPAPVAGGFAGPLGGRHPRHRHPQLPRRDEPQSEGHTDPEKAPRRTCTWSSGLRVLRLTRSGTSSRSTTPRRGRGRGPRPCRCGGVPARSLSTPVTKATTVSTTSLLARALRRPRRKPRHRDRSRLRHA